MQSLNSSTAKSTAILPLLGGGAAPKTGTGASSAEMGTSFSQMLRDSGPAVAPAPSPAAAAPASARAQTTTQEHADAKADAETARATEEAQTQAADAKPANAKTSAEAQAQRNRRTAQEREQATRQADARQAAAQSAGKAGAAQAQDGQALAPADERSASETEAASDDEGLTLDALTGAPPTLPPSAVPVQTPKAEGAAAAAQSAAAGSLLPGMMRDGATANPAKPADAEGKPAARAAVLDAGAKGTAGPAQALDLTTAKDERQQATQSLAGASFATELQHAEQTLTSPALPTFAAAAAAAQPGAAKTAAAETAARLDVASRLESPQFAAEMSTRLSVLAADGVQQAELHLNPAEMGPVSVQIVLDGQQAQISFHAENAETRNVLENSLPELASALRDQGLTLSGGGVFQQSAGQRQAQQFGSPGQNSRIGGEADDEGALAAVSNAAPPLRQQRGVVDLYA